MKKKVLMTTFTWPPNQDGVAMASQNLAAGLAARNFDITVATETHPRRTGHEVPGVEVREFNVQGWAHSWYPFRGDVDAYVRFVREYSCDFIICQYWGPWSTVLALRAFKENPAKKIFVSHGMSSHLWTFHPKPFFGIGQWLGRLPYAVGVPWTLRRFDHAVFLSEQRDWRRFLDHRLAHWTGYRSHSVIANGISPDLQQPSLGNFRVKYNIDAPKIVLNVANYCERKNQIYALEVFAQAAVPGSAMVFIGSERNEYTARLESRLRELQAGEFHLPVYILADVVREDVRSAFREAAVFLLTSKAETQPIVLLEAMASRVLFLSVDVGCVRSMPGGFVARSRKGLSSKLHFLLENPAVRERLANDAALAIGREYNWESHVNRFSALLSRL